jgi:hypothetical protein
MPRPKSEPLLVRVERITADPSAGGRPSTVVIGHGKTADDEAVTFAGDYRAMLPIAEAISAGEEPWAEVAPWQVLG